MLRRKERWLLGNGLVTALILLMVTQAFAGHLPIDEAGPCACFFMTIIAVILILQIIPATIIFLCFSGVMIVLLYKFYKNRNTIIQSFSDKGK